MTRNLMLTFAAAGIVTLAACEADQEALEEGVDLDAPAEIENAPLTDTVGPEGLGEPGAAGADTTRMQGVDAEPAPGDPM